MGPLPYSARRSHRHTVPRPDLAHTATYRVLLRPPTQLWVIVPRAELVQSGIGVEVATGELPGVGDDLALVQAIAIGVVVVAVLDGATAIDHFENRAEKVVVRTYCCSLTHQLEEEAAEYKKYVRVPSPFRSMSYCSLFTDAAKHRQ